MRLGRRARDARGRQGPPLVPWPAHFDQIEPADNVDLDATDRRTHSARPRLIERKTIDPGENVDPNRRHANLERDVRARRNARGRTPKPEYRSARSAKPTCGVPGRLRRVRDAGDADRLARIDRTGAIADENARRRRDIVVVAADGDHDVAQIRCAAVGRVE
jgi:hypothetical protein